MTKKIDKQDKNGSSAIKIKTFDESGNEYTLVYISGVRYVDENGDFWTSYDGINFRKDEFFK